jgi:hypothetical protein
MDSGDEYVKQREEDRLRDEEDEYNLGWYKEMLDEEEEKKKAKEERMRKQEEDYNEWFCESHGLNESKEAEKERLCREEKAHNEWLRESRLRDKEEEKRLDKVISSSPPSICHSCRKKPAQFKLTTVQFRSGCTCKDPVSHVGKVTNLCSFECSYWSVDKRYTEGGVRFVVMGGENECNTCGEPTMSTATYRLERLSTDSTVTSSSAVIHQ